MRQILSVDCGYDNSLVSFLDARRQFIEDNEQAGTPPEPPFDVDRLARQLCTTGRFLEYCDRRDGSGRILYDAICVSSHGAPGMVFGWGGAPEVLFSSDDDNDLLALIASGRSIYVCACETADSDLGDRLLSLGARLFVGFSQSPKWQTSDGARLWSRFDVDLFRDVALGRTSSGILETVSSAVQLAQSQLGLYDDYDNDIIHFMEVVNAMQVVD